MARKILRFLRALRRDGPWIVLIAIATMAVAPIDFTRWPELTRISGPNWGHQHAVLTTQSPIAPTNTAYSAGDEATAQCFAWGTRLECFCDARTSACVSMEDDVTLGSGATHGEVGDPHATIPDGIGKCASLEATTWSFLWVARELFPRTVISASSPPGYRTSACTAPAGVVGYPCDVDDDCSTGGTCSSSLEPTCAYVMLEGASATNCRCFEGI